MNFSPVLRTSDDFLRPCCLSQAKRRTHRFSEDAYRLAAEPKELYIVPGARHVDLYDRVSLIPFGSSRDFFTKNLK